MVKLFIDIPVKTLTRQIRGRKTLYTKQLSSYLMPPPVGKNCQTRDFSYT